MMSRAVKKAAKVTALIDIVLTANAEHRYGEAEAVCQELDRLDPEWIFWQLRAHPPGRVTPRDTSCEAQARQCVVAIVSLTHTNRKIAEWLGISPSRVSQIRDRGWRSLYGRAQRIGQQGAPGGLLFVPNGGDLEEDFDPPEVRREQRRRAMHERCPP